MSVALDTSGGRAYIHGMAITPNEGGREMKVKVTVTLDVDKAAWMDYSGGDDAHDAVVRVDVQDWAAQILMASLAEAGCEAVAE